LNNSKTIRNNKGAALPLSRRYCRPCGRAFSALFLLLGLSAISQANDTSRQQLEKALAQQMQQLITPLAKQQGWQKPQVQLQHELPGALPTQPCSQPLLVTRSGDDPSPLARQRFVLSCADASGWKVNASTLATVFVPVVFARVGLERGQGITAGDLQLQPVNIAKAMRGYFNQVEQVVGLSAKRRIREGQQLTPALLTGAVLVKRGQQVVIQANQDGIQAKAVGEALANGQLGDVIRVRNLGSEKVIEAKVIEAGVLSSTFK
jgi:flagella basal body P-ring formation protein FlgA